MVVLLFKGLFVGPLSEMQSHRWTTSIGIFLMGTGAILSSFSQSSIDLYISVGLIAGKSILQLFFRKKVFFQRWDRFQPKVQLILHSMGVFKFFKSPDISISCCNCHFTENSVKWQLHNKNRYSFKNRVTIGFFFENLRFLWRNCHFTEFSVNHSI